MGELLAMTTGEIVGTVVGIICGIAVLLIIVSFLVFKRLFSRPKTVYKPNAITRKMMGPELDSLNAFIAENCAKIKEKPNENITVTTDDGLKLNGYYYSCEQPTDKAVILSHGFNSTCYNTYSPQALFYLDNGFDVFMINHRAHENSEGAYSTFSIKEGADLLKWIDFAITKNPQYKIILQGNSMGATAVMEASCMELPVNVRCAIADCGFTSATDELYYQMTHMFCLPGFIAKPILGIMGFFCKTVAKFDLKGNSAEESVKHAKIPIMFVHGTADATVPVEQGKRNFAACTSPKIMKLYDGAGHGQSYYKCTESFRKDTLDFVSENLK